MVFSLFPLLESTRAATLQPAGLLPRLGGIGTVAPDLSLGSAALCVGLALLLVWAVLRRTS